MGQCLNHPGAGEQMSFLLLEEVSCCLHVWQYSQVDGGVKLFLVDPAHNLTFIRMSRYVQSMKHIAHVFKALSDETRLRILALLSSGELCVCDLMAALELPQSTVSRHLAYLRHAGLVADERRGVWMFYRLKQEMPLGKNVIPLLLEELKSTTQADGDCKALERLAQSTEKHCG